ncbi:MAG: hypothetical protein AAGC74_11960, partial [Verrucomicrobiota bacterium]
FLRIAAVKASESAIKTRMAEEAEKKALRKKRMVQLGLTGLVFLLVVGVGMRFFLRHRRATKPVLFPETSARRRLAAPYSGGGNVQVSYLE